jgi:hypothetical protein
VVPADDDGVLVALAAFALGDDDALVFGLAEDVDEGVPEAEEEAAAAAVCVELGLLVQVRCGLGRADALVVGLGLLLGLLVADEVLVVVGLGLLPADCVPVAVGLGLLLALALEPAVLSLLRLPPDDVAGAAVVWVALLGELLVVCVADERGEADVHGFVARAVPPGVTTPAGVGAGALLATSVLLEELGELPVKA